MSKTKKNALSLYKKRRQFNGSPEPVGKKIKRTSGCSFVIQKHAAQQLHYDFRLEIDGVLKSWAIPKGPSINPSDKRLALQTDDHPLEYARFEGVIPKDHYGAGTVMVWDRGTYKNIKKKNGRLMKMRQCYKDGLIEVELKGEKLHGGFALVKTKRADGKPFWLLVKKNDEYADRRRKPVSSQKNSAITGRSMKQIQRDES